MTIDEMMIAYSKRNSKPRKVGRYHASELYAIKSGEVDHKNFFNRKFDDVLHLFALVGVAFEDIFEKGLRWNEEKGNIKPFKSQTKYELKIDDFVLVVKPDFELEDKVIETKAHSTYMLQKMLEFFKLKFRVPYKSLWLPDGSQRDIQEKYLYQLEAEYRATNKPVFLGKFKIPFGVDIFPYEPSDERWEEIQNILRNLHTKLKEENGK